MPEMRFQVRWPDGTESVCYSPSLIVMDHFAAGASYPLGEFLRRSRAALTEASDRVRERYGFACSRALGQLAEIERRAAAGFAGAPDGAAVTVLAFHCADTSR